MEYRRPATGLAARRPSQSCLVLSLCVALLSGAPALVWGQGNNTAVITGADRVLIRRGPGRKFPPFAALTEGSAVEVEEMQGEWSRVKTANGQVGYVHSNFLALPSEAGAAAPPAAPEAAAQPTPQPTAKPTLRPTAQPTLRPTAQPTLRPTPKPTLQPTALPTPQPTARSDSAALNALTEKNKALEGQVSELQAELTALKSRTPPAVEPAATAAAGGDAAEMRAELKRLTAAVEGLRQRVGGSAPAGEAPAAGAASAEPPERNVSPAALLLGAVGLLTGWLLGAAYGRNQDRGRRSRIRF